MSSSEKKYIKFKGKEHEVIKLRKQIEQTSNKIAPILRMLNGDIADEKRSKLEQSLKELRDELSRIHEKLQNQNIS